MSKVRILVAEDDRNILQGLVDVLESEGYEAEAARDGDEALRAYEREKPDLLILDIMMPGKSGYDVCRQVRRKDEVTPVIMLTAKGEEIDKVLGLELGADDYVTKPFGVRELLARIAAVLRRARREGARADVAPGLPDVLRLGDAEIDRKRFTCRRGKKNFDLTAREIKLIEVFYSHPGEVLSRDQLLNAVWGIDYFGTTRTLDQHIAQLRKKVEARPAEPTVILSVHGVGYRYNAPE